MSNSSCSSSSSSATRPNDYFDLPEEAKADDQYVVEKILAKRRGRNGRWEYLLKWAGFTDADNTWEAQHDIHPDLIGEFERQQQESDASNPIYSTLGEDQPAKARTSTKTQTTSPPAKKKRKSSISSTNTTETSKKKFGVEKGWRVRAVIGAAKQKDSTVLYAVDYVQGSPVLREYVPSDIAHTYIPRELIDFFQKKIVWNTPSDKKKN